MVSERKTEVQDVPVGTVHEEDRETRPGKAVIDKAPPDACAIRPFVVKFLGLPPVEGELQGTLEHCQVVGRKYYATFRGCVEWVMLEGDKL